MCGDGILAQPRSVFRHCGAGALGVLAEGAALFRRTPSGFGVTVTVHLFGSTRGRTARRTPPLLSYAAIVISSWTARPAHAASATRASRLNLSMRPRNKSLRRGWVTPRRLAASVWESCHADTASLIAIISRERSFMFSASVGVSSSALPHQPARFGADLVAHITDLEDASRPKAVARAADGFGALARQRLGSFYCDSRTGSGGPL